MGAISKILFAVFNLLCVGVDIIIFFMVIRFLSMWRSIIFVEELNLIVKNMIDRLIVLTKQCWNRLNQKHLSDKTAALVAFLILVIIRFVISEICGLSYG